VEGSSEDGIEASVSINFGNFLSSLTTGGFSRRAHLYEVTLPTVNDVLFRHICKLKKKVKL
jgi:hypothetical protein